MEKFGLVQLAAGYAKTAAHREVEAILAERHTIDERHITTTQDNMKQFIWRLARSESFSIKQIFKNPKFTREQTIEWLDNRNQHQLMSWRSMKYYTTFDLCNNVILMCDMSVMGGVTHTDEDGNRYPTVYLNEDQLRAIKATDE